MKKSFWRRSLFSKIFISFLIVIFIWMAVMVIANQSALRSSFRRHMSDEMLMMMGVQEMHGADQGWNPSIMMDPENFIPFRQASNEALWLGLGAALVIAVVASAIISRQLAAPVRRMTSAAQRIAEGHYNERVPLPDTANEKNLDQLEQLAFHFNHMAESLEQTENMRRQLIGDVAHELRTPLTTIKGSMEGLIDGVLPQIPETYQKIHQEAQRLQRLVSDLQELSRVEGGAYALELQTLDPGRLVATVTERMSLPFAEKGVALVTDLAPDLPALTADEGRIGQVLINLTSNALNYTPEGGTVTITARQAGNAIRFEVCDTGIGIVAEHLANVFTRFYRVDKSRSRASGGTGVGLTIAKHLVESHGGEISAHSDGPGKGSVFSFTLPLVPTKSDDGG